MTGTLTARRFAEIRKLTHTAQPAELCVNVEDKLRAALWEMVEELDQRILADVRREFVQAGEPRRARGGTHVPAHCSLCAAFSERKR